MRESGIPRDDIFVTTKVWLSDFGYESTKKVRQQLHCTCRMLSKCHYILHPFLGSQPDGC